MSEHAYDEACAQMRDPERYAALMQLTFDQRHPCPVEDCRLSAEEHHRLSFGVLSELADLRRRVRELENGPTETEAGELICVCGKGCSGGCNKYGVRVVY